MSDVRITDHGTIWQIIILSGTAQEWWIQNVSSPDYMPLGFGDWRMMRDIALAMESEGFTVDRGNTSPLAWR